MIRKSKPRLLLVSLFVAAIMIFSACSGNDKEPLRSVSITRDDKGVWFIKGPDTASLYNIFESQGYAVATDRLWQAELFRRTARGKLSEVLGESQLQTDIFMRITGYSDDELKTGWDNLDPEAKTAIQAYVDGFNRRISEIRKDLSLLPYEFVAVGMKTARSFIPDDWTVYDVLAWTSTMLRNFDPEGNPASDNGEIENAALLQALMTQYGTQQGFIMFNDLRWTNDPDALTYIQNIRTLASFRAIYDAKDAGEKETILRNDDENFPEVPDLSKVASRINNWHKNIMENLKKINAYVKMGSYAWVVSGNRTASGNPIIYSGPQMGFSVPSIIMEGSIQAGDFNISGMAIAGLPGIVIGRTPHHAWSMQVGHAHASDYYIENPANIFLDRVETIKVVGGDDVVVPVYKSAHGPVINPLPYNPETYVPDPANPIITWKYAHRGYEFKTIKAYLDLARAKSMDEFGKAIEDVAVSQHFCYADKDGNIAYWMSGRDPVRPAGEWRLPQGFFPDVPQLEWDSAVIKPKSTERNPAKGYFAGWNNKTNPEYENSYNSASYFFGPFHRAQIVADYFETHDNFTFEQLRDFAINIATTDSFGNGGNPWEFVKSYFTDAVNSDPTDERLAALSILETWDGHFVDGGSSQWATGTDRSDGWVLMDAWIKEALRLTFEDELGPETYEKQPKAILFNVMLHGLNPESSIKNNYNWFQNATDENAPQNSTEIITAALDNVLDSLGARPWGIGERGVIEYKHDLIGVVHTMPFFSRSTYAHCVEMSSDGPVKIESMFPLGQSGTILMNKEGKPVFDENFFTMTPVYDQFVYREFPLFE